MADFEHVYGSSLLTQMSTICLRLLTDRLILFANDLASARLRTVLCLVRSFFLWPRSGREKMNVSAEAKSSRAVRLDLSKGDHERLEKLATALGLSMSSYAAHGRFWPDEGGRGVRKMIDCRAAIRGCPEWRLVI